MQSYLTLALPFVTMLMAEGRSYQQQTERKPPQGVLKRHTGMLGGKQKVRWTRHRRGSEEEMGFDNERKQ